MTRYGSICVASRPIVREAIKTWSCGRNGWFMRARIPFPSDSERWLAQGMAFTRVMTRRQMPAYQA